MFSVRPSGKPLGEKTTSTYVSRGTGGAMTRTDNQSQPQCPDCCLSPTKFFRISAHIMKLSEVGLGGVCWYLLWQFGIEEYDKLGLGYDLFQLVNSGASFTAAVLFLCYSVSCIKGKTFMSVRPSLFEVLFTLICSILYFVSSALLMESVYRNLHYIYHQQPEYIEYPALTAVYVLGFVLGVVNLVDCVLVICFMCCRQNDTRQQTEPE